MLKLSVVIPSFNDLRLVETLESIFSQDYDQDRVKVYVMDGGSRADVVEKISAALRPQDVLVSEPDKGIFDGINKGIRMADGELIFTIGSDDLFAGRDAFSTFSNAVESSGADYAVCGTIYCQQDLTPFRHWPATKPRKWGILMGRQTCHFAFAARPSVYEQLGDFDLQYRTAADYDFFVRLAKRKELSGVEIRQYLVKMRQGGHSSKNLRNLLKGNNDIRRILIKHFGYLGQLVLLFKMYWKATEIVRTKLLLARQTS
jgi:glycosyltransferase